MLKKSITVLVLIPMILCGAPASALVASDHPQISSPLDQGVAEGQASSFLGQNGGFGGGFLQNDGQLKDPSVRFYSKNVRFTSEGIFIKQSTKDTFSVYEMELLGSSAMMPTGVDRMDTNYNFFLGSDPTKWASDVHSYNTVRYPEVYSGIDLEFKSSQEGLKYEFHVRPGADPGQIRLRYVGASPSMEGGQVRLDLPTGTVFDGGLTTYKIAGTERQTVASSFVLKDGVLGFDVPSDSKNEIVIDPIISSTFLGGSGAAGDFAYSASRYPGNNDNIVAGASSDADFPTTTGAYKEDPDGFDAFVASMMQNGKVRWASFIGGAGNDQALSVAEGKFFYIAITGFTTSTDYPVVGTPVQSSHKGAAGTKDAFVTQINEDGTALFYSTYLGGSGNDTGHAIIAQGVYEMFLTGETNSSDFPTTSGAYNTTFKSAPDVFVTSLDFNDLIYSTLLPGSGTDVGLALALNSAYHVYVTGKTDSNDFPVSSSPYDGSRNGGFDMFVSELDENGQFLRHSTFIGAASDDYGTGLAINSTGDVFVTGYTESQNFPIAPEAFDTSYNGNGDAFIITMPWDLHTISAGTYLGGSKKDSAVGVYLDLGGRPIVYGETQSDDLPTTPKAYDTSYNGGTQTGDAFLTKLELNLSALNYSTYLGGSSNDVPTGIAGAGTDDVVVTGYTSSTDFPTTADASSTTFKGGAYDGFVVQFNLSRPPGPPTGLMGWSGDRYVELTWTEPAQKYGLFVTSYGVYRGVDPKNLALIKTLSGSYSNWYNDTTVSNGKVYYFAISAFSSAGEGDRSEVASFTTGAPPTAPMNLKAFSQDRSVRLTWGAPLDTKGFAVTNYTVYRSKDGSVWTKLVKLGKNLSYMDVNLINGRAYSYTVSANNSMGEGPRAAAVQATPATISSPPYNLTATGQDSNVILEWSVPKDDGGANIDSYYVYRSVGGIETLIDTKSSWNKLFDTGLQNGKTYLYSVAAKNVQGLSNRSEVLAVTVGTQPYMPYLQALPGPGCVRLIITMNNDGGFPVIKYNYKRGTTVKNMSYIGNFTGTFFEDYNITYNTTYYYSVDGVNIKGEGQWSFPVHEMPDWGVPGMVSNLTIDTAFKKVSLNWGVPNRTGGPPVLRYNIYRGPSANAMHLYAMTGGLNYTDIGVRNGDEYYYCVNAVNSIGEGALTPPEMVVPRGEPSSVTLSAKTTGEAVKLSWTKPSDNGGLDVQGYRIYKGNGTDNATFLATVTLTMYTDLAVVQGMKYNYYVTAFNLFGESAPSNLAVVDHGSVPSAPVSMKVSAKGLSVKIEWRTPSELGGHPIQKYRVYKGTSPDSMYYLNSTADPSFVDKEVQRGKTYYYKVSAVNDLGEGNATAPVRVVFQKDTNAQNLTAPILVITGIVVATVVGVTVYRIGQRRGKK